jgi:multidrug resistance efflux pump
MKATLWTALVLIGVLAAWGFHWRSASLVAGPGPAEAELSRSSPTTVAAEGVTEGSRPEVALRPEIIGTIARLYVEENQQVQRGDPLVQLDNEVQKADVELARARLEEARASCQRLQNGERQEQREAAAAELRHKQAMLRQARAIFERTRRSGVASAEQVEHEGYAVLQAEAACQKAQAEKALVEAPARTDELAAATARVSAAEAQLRRAEAELARTCLRAPSAGRILRIYHEPGTLVRPDTAQPILLLADLSRCRVRAFVEELDAFRVRIGQAAVVRVDGLPGRDLAGHVKAVLPRMGKRAPISDDPDEFRDVYHREVLIELDPGAGLPLNLRVRTWIQVD